MIDRKAPLGRPAAVLLVGPYDPKCGEFTFLAPPLGVWRLQAYLESHGVNAHVFDPNNCSEDPGKALHRLLLSTTWDAVGFSTTGMTLRYDLSLARMARRYQPDAVLVAGGMEATFDPGTVMALGEFDLVVLGEGEKPLTEIARRLSDGEALFGVPSTAVPLQDGGAHKFRGVALNYEEFRAATLETPYETMPYPDYWARLESAYRINALPEKSAREARLSEIRSVRIPTLNYCPMACTFCSSTNFLHEVQGKVAKVTRLDANDCLTMIDRVVAAQPGVKTIIWQDDIFVFTKDNRIVPLCEGIIEGKKRGRFPADLQFISTNRIDAMTPERLTIMRQAGFRVLGFGVENFSESVLKEFNKAQIFRHIDTNLNAALDLGIVPFLDLIMSSPRSHLQDIHTTIVRALHWIRQGCEVGLYPYVIPFSGAVMARDESLLEHTVYEDVTIAGTTTSWRQPVKILPIRPEVRRLVEKIEVVYEARFATLETAGAHLPSRVRSLIWIESALPLLAEQGLDVPDTRIVTKLIQRALPRPSSESDSPSHTRKLACNAE